MANVREIKDKRERDDVIFKNRRDSLRVSEQLEVDFVLDAKGPHNFFNGFTQDISKGGIFIATHQIYPIGTEMRLSFKLGSKTITTDAVVRWVKKPENVSEDIDPGMGLQFINLEKADQELIDEFIKKKEPLFFDDDE